MLVQDDLNLGILHMFEDTFSVDKGRFQMTSEAATFFFFFFFFLSDFILNLLVSRTISEMMDALVLNAGM